MFDLVPSYEQERDTGTGMCEVALSMEWSKHYEL